MCSRACGCSNSWIQVDAVNTPPVAGADSASTKEDGAITLNLADLLANDSDADGDPLSIIDISTSHNGNVSINGAHLIFTPSAQFNGTGVVTYSLSDGYTTTPGTLSITVTSVNDAPSGSDKTITIFESSQESAIFSDDFDQNSSALNQIPSGWSINNGGTVDICGPGFFDFLPNNGRYVDLDGSSSQAGLLSRSVVLNAGSTYTLAFYLAGSQRGSTENVHVSFGTASKVVTVQSSDPFRRNTLNFTPTTTGIYNLSFLNEGGDSMGALLDSVEVRKAGLLTTDYAFTTADFGFTDPVDAPQSTGANMLNGLILTTLPAAGTLRLGGALVSAGQEIIAAHLSNLTYTPPTHADGDPFASFRFQVRDNGGTANGGLDLDPSPNTIQFTTTPSNAPPTATNLSAPEQFLANTPLNLIDILVNDVDSPTVHATLTLSQLAAGSLSTATIHGVTSSFIQGVWSASGSPSVVSALLEAVSFLPAAGFYSDFTIASSVSDGRAAPLTGTKAVRWLPSNGIFRLSAASYGSDENSGGSLPITIHRDGPLSGPASVTVQVISGTATAGKDFVNATQQIFFASDEASKTVELAILDDNSQEPEETFTVQLTNPTNGALLSGTDPVTAQVTIHDDDPPLTVPTVNPLVTLDRTPLLTGTATVLSGHTFHVVVGGHLFTHGSTSALQWIGTNWSLQIPVDKALSAGTYNVVATVVDSDNQSQSDTTTGELQIDSPAPQPTLTLLSTTTFTEDAAANGVGSEVATFSTNAALAVALSDTLHYALGTGTDADKVLLTAAGLALVNGGTDLPAFTLTPSQGAVTGTAVSVDPSVVPVNDGAATVVIAGTARVGSTLMAETTSADPDGNGAFTTTWQTSSDGNAWSPVSSEASYTVAASDEGRQLRLEVAYTDGQGFPETVTTPSLTVALLPTITITAGSPALPEGSIGSTPFPFLLIRSGDLAAESRVAWRVEGSGSQPAADFDFAGGQRPSGTVVFAPGEASRSLAVNVVGDGLLEPDEGFRLQLHSAAGARLEASGSTAVTEIRNDDVPAMTYSFVATPDAVFEGGTLHIGVTTTNVEAGRPLWWQLFGPDITAADFSDGLLSGSTVIGLDGRAAFTKTIAVDLVVDPHELLEVRFFSDAGLAHSVGSSLTVTLKEPSVGVVTDGNDVITGTAAAEAITGVPAGFAARGRGSLDRLTGGGGADLFLLGDAQGPYYDDGTTGLGSADLAVITDFTLGDRIQLHGTSGAYRLMSGRHGGVPGLRIDALASAPGNSPEAIGFVQGATLATFNLANANQFLYL